MRKVTAGDGSDSTTAVKAYLQAGSELRLVNCYLFGDPEDAAALWLCDYESPLSWPVWTREKRGAGFAQAFDPAAITRGTVTSQVGLQVESLDITWTPHLTAFTRSVATANPYQLAQIGFWDNWKVRVWTGYMPTPGDLNTYGCSELFGGRVGQVIVDRGAIKFQVKSFLDVVNQNVPTNTIELTNTMAAYTGATPPAGIGSVPTFTAVAGDSPTLVIGRCLTPSSGQIFSTNAFQHGFLVFTSGSLKGLWSAVQQNVKVTVSGTDYNQFLLYAPLPWSPSPGDNFYVSASAPVDQADGSYYGFPYVPDPAAAV